ncbi:MAG: branched-chain amino acid ABC transporter permease [Limnochordales bacterium]|nr:branched-chain amino acid ABC transporter permease [Limnochordales bacterium]
MVNRPRDWVYVFGILLALGLLPLAQPSEYVLSFLYFLFSYAAMAVAWNVLGGFGGYLSFGHVTFFGTGAYVTGLMLVHWGWSPLITAPLGGLAAALLALVIGYPTLRLRGPYFTVVTVVTVLIAKIVVLNVPLTGAAMGLWMPFPPWDPFTSRVIFYEAVLVLLLAALLMARWVQHAKFGFGLRVIREDEDAAAAIGVPAFRLKLGALLLSAFVCGMVGAVHGYDRSYLHPDFMFDLHPSIMMVLMALFGGRDHWLGPLVGAVAVMITDELLTVYVGTEAARMLFGLLLIIVVLFLPEGVISLRLPKKPPRAAAAGEGVSSP